VDIEWRDGRATGAKLRPGVDGDVVIAAPPGQRIAELRTGDRPAPVSARTNRTVTVPLRAGREYALRFAAR
jgi:hypothetical protein